jgi:hypothetical protein
LIVKTKYIIQHRAGHYINLHYDPIKEFNRAARFESIEEANHFYRDSYYKVDDPENYFVVPIKISYELGGSDDAEQK